MLKVGEAMPKVSVVDQTGAAVATTDLLGKPLVVYFYPKADTPGCTNESTQFRDLYAKMRKAGAEVIGVSRDTPAAQLKFKEKYDLPFRLLADTESKVCDAFGVIVDKNMYGKISRGIQRSTFLFDATGKIVHVWPRVTVEGHAEDVMSRLP
jgi:thioredoxin-dependent peroxiredoxin